MTPYPIDTILPAIQEAVLRNPSVILGAPPGAGKTTRVPLALLQTIPPERGRIVMLEPRRIAAVSAARWMAKSLNEQPGETIGYTIRFDSRKSEKTRIEVVTEGVLTRRFQSDPGLQGVALVIFDEFHERSIHADLALALCLDVRKQLREDLKIMVMSATLDPGALISLLGNPKVISSAGKSFSVEERYISNGGTDSAGSRVPAAIRTALRDTNGDILAFLPGSGEIRACDRDLRASLNLNEERIELHPLYGDLPFEEQERALTPSKDRRKIVLATNIAETSLTIEGVHVVIDSGLTRMLRYDPSTGMNRLVTVPVSKASAEQRKGRAGRQGPGVCYRLYGRHEFQGMASFGQPEILVSDLTSLALELAVWGVKEPETLSWLDAPPAAAWHSGRKLLMELGALDANGSVSRIGREMAALPLHPRLSRLLLKAAELDCVGIGADLAAILSEREIFTRHASSEYGRPEPDLSERIEMLWGWRETKLNNDRLDISAAKAVDRTSKQLLKIMPRASVRRNVLKVDDQTLARLVLCAYPDRICKRREEGGGRFVSGTGRGLRLAGNSHLAASPYIIAVKVDAGEKAEGFIHIAASVPEETIRIECRDRIRTIRRVEWDHKERRITAAIEERLDSLILSQRPFTPSDEEAAPILCEVVRANPGIITITKEVRQFQARTLLMKRSFPEEDWLDLSGEELLRRPEEWLVPWLQAIRTADRLTALDILPAVRARFSRKQISLLDERLPLLVPVPSGNRAKIDYTAGELPVLAVKLQEMFGLADTPVMAGGRVKVLLHLLSPAGRPVQITHDLKSFWNTGYPLVKKDLKGRYPRHPWPDDPWNAVPTRRTKPRGK